MISKLKKKENLPTSPHAFRLNSALDPLQDRGAGDSHREPRKDLVISARSFVTFVLSQLEAAHSRVPMEQGTRWATTSRSGHGLTRTRVDSDPGRPGHGSTQTRVCQDTGLATPTRVDLDTGLPGHWSTRTRVDTDTVNSDTGRLGHGSGRPR